MDTQDHLEVYVPHAATQPVLIAHWLATATSGGSASSGSSAAAASARLTTSRPAASCAATTRWRVPNLMFHVLPIAIRYDARKPAESEHSIDGWPGSHRPMYADSRGWERIGSPDSREHPANQPNYLSTEKAAEVISDNAQLPPLGVPGTGTVAATRPASPAISATTPGTPPTSSRAPSARPAHRNGRTG